MSNSPRPFERVMRLLDVLVEEVSLVDRAANKRRFLVVKRRDGMSANTANPAPGANTNGEGAAPEGQQEASAPEATNNETPPEASASGEQESGAFNVAVEVLEGLTDAVEALAGLDESETNAGLAQLGTELKTVSDKLLGVTTSTGSENSSSTNGEQQQPAPAAPAPQAQEQQQPQTQPAETSRLLSSINSLVDAVKAQQQRLARIEKSFGMPNSVPAGERSAPAAEESWPLDLNAPVDREHVDKSLSFHDVERRSSR